MLSITLSEDLGVSPTSLGPGAAPLSLLQLLEYAEVEASTESAKADVQSREDLGRRAVGSGRTEGEPHRTGLGPGSTSTPPSASVSCLQSDRADMTI